jgi:hypothetical protein
MENNETTENTLQNGALRDEPASFGMTSIEFGDRCSSH